MKNTLFLILLCFFLNLTAQKTNPEAIKFYESALSKGSSGDSKGAISDLNKAIELYPDYAEAYLSRGANYFQMANFKEAIVDLTKSIL
jgi:tetratricopeptide (TPR) repeat protein